MARQWNVAVVGATGVVGREILRVLEERDFPVGELRLLASERSEGDFLGFGGEELLVRKLTLDAFPGIDIAFFAAGDDRSREFCPAATAAGAVCVDTSSAWRMDPEVPLVVREVNPEILSRYAEKRIIASPGGPVIQMAVALKPLHDYAIIRRIVVSTYQSVSGAGRKGIEELRLQAGELLNGRPVECKAFPHPIAFNCLPRLGNLLEDGYTREEMRMIEETRRILADDSIGVSVTAVGVPVFYGHSESINIETEKTLTVEKARELIAGAPGCKLVDRPAQEIYPMPVDATGQDLAFVGRIREDRTVANGLNLWVCADNLRQGAATNAVQIAEVLAAEYL